MTRRRESSLGRIKTSLLSVALLGLTACATAGPVGPVGRLPEGDAPVFPAPPDEPRVQFLMSLSTEFDVKGQPKEPGWFDRLTGTEAEDQIGRIIQKPYGLAFSNDQLFVCDAYLRGFVRIDLNARTFEAIMPSGQGALNVPINCDVDEARGRLLMTDTQRRQVVVLGLDGAYQDAIDLPTPGGVPSDVVVYGTEIWVLDMNEARIHVYDAATLTLLRSTPEDGATTEEGLPLLGRPINLDVSERGYYVTDLGDFRVKAFGHDGTLRWSVGGVGRTPGSFARPKGVAADDDGLVFVVDAAFENVQIFDDDAQALMFFGGSGTGPGNMYLPAQVRVYRDGIDFFRPYVTEGFELDAVVFVTNQYGPSKVSVFGLIRSTEASDEVPGS